MILERSRRALDQAEQAFAKLSAVAVDNSEQFRDEFVSCIAMIHRVGPIIDAESKRHRTHAFGTWWTATAQDPLFHFITEVRNAEFKRAEDRKRAHHNIHVHDTVTSSESVHIAVIRDGQVVEERSYRDPPPPPQPTPEPTHTVTWYFAGGRHDGQEVLPLLRRYLDWIRNVLLPEAEHRTA
jgi:hypothetical protein